jgi:hypothetical protein
MRIPQATECDLGDRMDAAGSRRVGGDASVPNSAEVASAVQEWRKAAHALDVLALIFLPASPAFSPLPTMRPRNGCLVAIALYGGAASPYSSNASLDRTLAPLCGPDVQRERAERRGYPDM